MKYFKTLGQTLTLAALCVWGTHASQAESNTTAVRQAATELDALLEAHWKTNGQQRNAALNDEGFVRRIYLDLAGRIPSSAEAEAFLLSRESDKRERLIEELLQSEAYVQNFYNFWADILRFKSHRVNTPDVIEACFEKYLKDSIRSNKPYDRFVYEMLSAKGYAWDNGAIGYYQRDFGMPLDNMAITSRIFLGTRIECAQCHDHPFDKWKQTEFYHLAAYTHSNNQSDFLARAGVRDAYAKRLKEVESRYREEKAASTDGGKQAEATKARRLEELEVHKLMESARDSVGQLESPVDLQRDSQKHLKLPHDFKESDGKPFDVIKPAPLMGRAAEVNPGEDPAEPFARWLTSVENPRFTKVLVNRLWKRVFGAPLVEAFEDLRDTSEAMIPSVEEYLEKSAVRFKYDLKALLAVLVNTRAYQSAAVSKEFAAGEPCHFTGPFLRRMTAEQMWDSMVTLTNHEPDAKNLNRYALDERRVAVSKMANAAYLAYEPEGILELGIKRVKTNQEFTRQLAALNTELAQLKKEGAREKITEVNRRINAVTRERAQTAVDQFITPMLNNLARKTGGEGARPVQNPNYKFNQNPNVFPVETWRSMHVEGFGPLPSTASDLQRGTESQMQQDIARARSLGLPESEYAAFAAYCAKARSEWLRAAELESPAPRGHFLRTMGQSDRDFVENASLAASIPQALLMMNGELASASGLLAPYSPLSLRINSAKTPEEKVNAVYLSLLSRNATRREKDIWFAADAKGLGSTDDLVFALLNTRQFIFIE